MIEFKDVSKVYGNGTRGLDHIQLTIGDGEFVSIIGLSGAGKSTLLRSINRLNDVTEGEVVVDGTSITRADKRELRRIRRRIGMISQSFNLVKRSTVQKNVLSGRLGYYSTFKSIFGLFTEEDYKNTEKALATVGLLDKLHSRSDELSGGQQQRVSIARTLALNPKVILFDEPMSALDVETRLSLRLELKRIQKEFGTTMIYITHDQEEAFALSDRVMVMGEGRIHQLATPDDMIAHPADDYVADFVVKNLNIKMESLARFMDR